MSEWTVSMPSLKENTAPIIMNKRIGVVKNKSCEEPDARIEIKFLSTPSRGSAESPPQHPPDQAPPRQLPDDSA